MAEAERGELLWADRELLCAAVGWSPAERGLCDKFISTSAAVHSSDSPPPLLPLWRIRLCSVWTGLRIMRLRLLVVCAGFPCTGGLVERLLTVTDIVCGVDTSLNPVKNSSPDESENVSLPLRFRPLQKRDEKIVISRHL